MNEEECGNWLRRHRSLHSDFAGWMRTLDAEEVDAFRSATEACLRLVPLERAMDTSQQMFEGKVKKPYAFSDHPATVRQHGEPAYSLGGSSQRTLGEIEELARQARNDPMRPIAQEYREFLASIGRVPAEKQRPLPGGPQSAVSARVGKCPYCEGTLITINEIGHCCDCLARIGDVRLPFAEAGMAKSCGERKHNKSATKGS